MQCARRLHAPFANALSLQPPTCRAVAKARMDVEPAQESHVAVVTRHRKLGHAHRIALASARSASDSHTSSLASAARCLCAHVCSHSGTLTCMSAA